MSSRHSEPGNFDFDADDSYTDGPAGVPETPIDDDHNRKYTEPEKTGMDYGGLEDEDETGEHKYAIEQATRPKDVKVETMKVYPFFLAVACTHIASTYF